MRRYFSIAVLVSLAACGGDDATDGGDAAVPLVDAGSDDGANDASVTVPTLVGPAALTQTACSYDAFELEMPAGSSATTMALSSSGVTFYAEADCRTVIDHVDLAPGPQIAKLYAIASVAGTVSIHATPTSGATLGLDVPVYHAVNVRAPDVATGLGAGAAADDVTDDSAKLQAAITYASATLARDFPSGPLGTAQAIVYVPPGTYRIKNVTLADDVRIEVSAEAIFHEALPRDDTTADSLFKLDKPSAMVASPVPLSNATLIGVGTDLTGVKPMPAAGWDISHSFTVNVDPVATGASQNVQPILIEYAHGILVENLYSVANNSDPAADMPNGASMLNPFTKLFGHPDATDTGAGFYAPTQITYVNHYHRYGCLGCGAAQVQAGHALSFSKIFSEGGIALRFETDRVGDNTLHTHQCESLAHGGGGGMCDCTMAAPCALEYASEIAGATGDTIACLDGNAAVSFVPHNQKNIDVAVSNVTSNNCNAAIVTGNGSADTRLPAGSFESAAVNGVVVIGSNVDGNGTQAQGGQPGPQDWLAGQESDRAICWVDAMAVPLTVTACTYKGDFQNKTPSKCLAAGSSMCSAAP